MRRRAGARDGFRPLFDGVSLKGWKRQPRSLAQPSLGIWKVKDGVITGGQEPAAVLQKGRAGHIALEVYTNGPNDKLGKDRWALGAVCRWRNISIKTL